jgi:hypothetical protein
MSTYQSVTTSAWAFNADVVLNKPSGLAVGDLMMAILAIQIGTDTSFTVPSGWTSYATSSHTGLKLTFLTKLAESADVSASTFTFTKGNADSCVGALMRINNFGFIDQTAVTNKSSASVSLTGLTGVTPTKINELLIMAVVGSAGSGTDPTYSSYAVATSNPTWTEIFDVSHGSATAGFACAVATRPEITATGNASITLDTYPTGGNYIVRLISLAPRVDSSSTPSAIGNAYFRVPPHIQPIKNVSFSIPESTSTSRDKILWTNETKPTTTWTNETL